MGRGATGRRLALSAMAAVLAGAAVAKAQTALTISDARRIETNSGSFFVNLNVLVVGGPNVTGVSVTWATVDGSAKSSDNDYVAASPTVLNIPPPSTSGTIAVEIKGDTNPEWSPTLQQEEVFFVDLTSPVNATIQKARATVTIVDDDRTMPGLQYLSAVSDGTITAGRNRLQWRVPVAPVAPSNIAIRWNVGAGCLPPATSADGTGILITPAAGGQKQQWDHNGLPLQPHCYALFTMYGATPTNDVATIKATPFDSTGNVVWSYATGSANVVPPTVGQDAVYTIGTDGVVHAMQRGTLATSGLWPPNWNPVGLGKPAHNRSPVVPLPAGRRLFVGTEEGEVHCVDGDTGTLVWSRSALFGGTQLPGTLSGVQATPAGLFKIYTGLNDMILVGTNTAGSNYVFALNPATGTPVTSYFNPSMTAINGMAVVDYPGNRAFFGATSPSFTLWGLNLGPSGSPALTNGLPWSPKPLGAGALASAVMRGDRLYLPTLDGSIHAVRVSDGASYSYNPGDGQAKGFVWPDRRDDRIYFSTTGKVHALRDTGDIGMSLVPVWAPVTLVTPSIVLQKPGTSYLYVGDGNGRLVQLDANSGAQISIPVVLEAGVQMGAPSLDNGNDLVLVGSVTGVIYAVRVPF